MVQLKYFGDDRDYFKYDLITSIFEARFLAGYVYIPMLTGHRKDSEGKKAPKYNGDRSLSLYEFIKTRSDNSLNHWEKWLTPCVTSYKTVKPADETYFRDETRTGYWGKFNPLVNIDKVLAFVDPDTGLQTGTPSYRRAKGSEKYILNSELNELFRWIRPASILMIYQHLSRDESLRICSIQQKLLQVKGVCKTAFTCAYREGDLAFVFVAKSEEMFTKLLYFLNRYYDKSMHRHKDIVQLYNEPHLSTYESMTSKSNVGQRNKDKTISADHKEGVITNAEELTAREVAGKQVYCPACHKKMVFKKWPLGWDAHAASKCIGVKGSNPEERKVYFRQRFTHLFKP